MNKKQRHNAIIQLVSAHAISCQDDLLQLLQQQGYELTQATLSRDIKELKIVKNHTPDGDYAYQLPNEAPTEPSERNTLTAHGFISIDFSGQLAVIKTRPGYAMGIASEIDQKATGHILGTVAGDDTILLIPRENISRKEVIASLSQFIPIK